MTVSVVSETMFNGDAIANFNNPPAAPGAPVVVLVQAGAQSARQESVRITSVNGYGESAPSPEVIIQVPANFVISVRGHANPAYNTSFPAAPTGWNVYVTTGASGTETKQNRTPIPFAATPFGGNPESSQPYWTEPAAGLIAGASLPTAVAPTPKLQSGLANLVNTPPVPNQDIHIDNTNKNTGRTAMATQTFLSKFSGIS